MRKTGKYLYGMAVVFIIMVGLLFIAPSSVRAEAFAYSVTPDVNKAATKYMTEMYIQNHPEMGKEICYGSPSQIDVLRELAGKITSGVSGAGKKADAIARWVKRNIRYVSMSEYQYPFDVLCARESNCYGDAYLMQTLMRLSGIPAVVGAGQRGDMKKVIEVSWLNDNTAPTWLEGHAWVYAWYSGEWHLYDPLFDVYDWTDSSQIDAWYCNSIIEGIYPCYAGMNMKLFTDGYCLFWKDGRPILYAGGKPCSEAQNGVRDTEWGNSSTQFLGGVNAFSFPAFYHSGFRYLENDEARKAKMIPDEVLSGGWIVYDGYPNYVRPNGIVVTNTMREYNGEWLYYSYDGTPLKCSLPISDISLQYGLIELPVGSSMTLYPDTWERMNQDDKFYSFSTDSKGAITVDSLTGSIKGISPGQAKIEAAQYSHEEDGKPDSERTHWGFAYIDVLVVKEKRTPSLEDRPIKDDEESEDENAGRVDEDSKKISLSSAVVKVKDSVYSGKKKTPAPVVTLHGEKLEKGKDYTVAYLNNIKIGVATVNITGIGKYSGKVTKTFTIRPPKTSILKVKAGAKKLTVNWKAMTGTVTGYQLQYSTDKGFKNVKSITIKKAKTKTTVIKNLKAKKTYYIRIRTWKKVSRKKIYSEWSKAVKKKTL